MVDLSKYSLSDLETLETELWSKYNTSLSKLDDNKDDELTINELLESKLGEVRAEINNRVDKFLNS